MKELSFQLENKLTFMDASNGGAENQTMEITLRAPTFEDRKFYARMHSHVSNAFMSMVTKLPSQAEPEPRKKASEDMDGSTAITLLSAGSPDFDKVLEDFTGLALRVGFLNEETPLVDKHIRDIGIDQLMRMCGEYVAFFIAPSLLSMTKKSGSKA